jgi:hypothetical protein
VGPFILVDYDGYVEASMQGYSKVSVGPFIRVHYDGLLESFMQGFNKASKYTPPAALCPGERSPGTHCTGGWVGPRSSLDTEVGGKILCPCRRSNLDHAVVQSVDVS